MFRNVIMFVLVSSGGLAHHFLKSVDVKGSCGPQVVCSNGSWECCEKLWKRGSLDRGPSERLFRDIQSIWRFYIWVSTFQLSIFSDWWSSIWWFNVPTLGTPQDHKIIAGVRTQIILRSCGSGWCPRCLAWHTQLRSKTAMVDMEVS